MLGVSYVVLPVVRILYEIPAWVVRKLYIYDFLAWVLQNAHEVVAWVLRSPIAQLSIVTIGLGVGVLLSLRRDEFPVFLLMACSYSAICLGIAVRLSSEARGVPRRGTAPLETEVSA